MIKGIVTEFSSNHLGKDGNFHRNLNLIKNVEDNVVFLTQKSLILLISPLLLISTKCAGYFCREAANEDNQFKETKTWF